MIFRFFTQYNVTKFVNVLLMENKVTTHLSLCSYVYVLFSKQKHYDYIFLVFYSRDVLSFISNFISEDYIVCCYVFILYINSF